MRNALARRRTKSRLVVPDKWIAFESYALDHARLFRGPTYCSTLATFNGLERQVPISEPAHVFKFASQAAQERHQVLPLLFGEVCFQDEVVELDGVFQSQQTPIVQVGR